MVLVTELWSTGRRAGLERRGDNEFESGYCISNACHVGDWIYYFEV